MHCGEPHTCEEVEALEEYPCGEPGAPAEPGAGQCVLWIDVPGLETFAGPTAAAIVALRNNADALIEAADEAPNVIGFVDWRGEDWLTGTGSQSNIQYDGNQDWAIGDVAGTDTIHPSHAGWKLLLIPRLIEAIAPMEI